MPGTVKIWWHDGALNDLRRNPAPIVNEPELGFEQVGISPIPSLSQPAPADCFLAVIESDVDVRYKVTTEGTVQPADPVTSKPMPATGLGADFIAVRPGATISFIEV